jgi:hypothetical protein
MTFPTLFVLLLSFSDEVHFHLVLISDDSFKQHLFLRSIVINRVKENGSGPFKLLSRHLPE